MVWSSHQKTNFACKKNLKVKKRQGIYCTDLIFAHTFLQCMQKESKSEKMARNILHGFNICPHVLAMHAKII